MGLKLEGKDLLFCCLNYSHHVFLFRDLRRKYLEDIKESQKGRAHPDKKACGFFP